jgi:hypothetical protein
MESAQEMETLVREHRRELESLSFPELAKLSEFETVLTLPSGASLTVARKINPDGSLTIVVEGWRPRLLGVVTQCHGEGFRVNQAGERQELEERDHW